MIDSGYQIATVRDQAEQRISGGRLSFQMRQGTRTGLVNQHVLETSMFIEDDTAQAGLLVETASPSPSCFEELKKHPVPVEEVAVRQIANNGSALDAYCRLAYRLHSLKEPITASSEALHGQFGRSVARLDHFKDHFRSILRLATSAYPDANREEAPSGAGLILKSSRPPVPGKDQPARNTVTAESRAGSDPTRVRWFRGRHGAGPDELG